MSDQYTLVRDNDLRNENKVFRQCVKDIDPAIQVESYWVKTEDGYHLKLFRLVRPERSEFGPPVLMQHGLFQNAEKFVWDGANSLAIELLDLGFDIWLGNNRGNIYSNIHDEYDMNHDQADFYDYSFFEMGKYDQPAQIGGILNFLPDHDNLIYVGYS